MGCLVFVWFLVLVVIELGQQVDGVWPLLALGYIVAGTIVWFEMSGLEGDRNFMIFFRVVLIYLSLAYTHALYQWVEPINETHICIRRNQPRGRYSWVE